MQDKESAYRKISELVERFQEQFVSYKKSDYNETLTRRDFIDPFFKALGWDIDNESGYAEAYREVIHEDKVRIGGATKAPDYSFRLPGGKRLFFVEAKKPSVAIKEEIQPAYQVRRYGWSAKLPISVITDFEEFSIYDCSKKPIPTDKASVARIKYLTFKEYLDEFDFLWNTFSKERVLKGSFDKFVEGSANKKGTATVDKDFLQSLDGWRTLLANSISKLNKELDEDELNFAVQQTIDRIIFLRIAEDRNIEPYGSLAFAVKQGDFYSNLYSIFKDADDKYNSGLFNLKKDLICSDLKIENKVLKSIINQLYYPESPYEFSVLAVEILGSAYEQFLGKQIKISKSHKAVIEEKPEVRKAGGVYYTPQYIVNYIVENTVGKLLEDKTPEEVSKIKIVDPACGSGSFLLGAYQHLLDWHKSYYTKYSKPSRGGKDNPLTPEGNLTTSEKKRILTNNIFGVDIDTNAVEVTKLSLLLKCLEGETQASIANQLSLFNERVLPTLDENIKSGNSLIDLDFYDNELDFGFEKKVKPFSWQKAFPHVFKQGGFDAVIGNPPYLKLTSHNTESSVLQYYFRNYVSYSGGSSKNLYQLFLERMIELRPKKFSFIVPEAILTTESNGKIRELLLQQFRITSVVNFDHFVFEGATIGTSIIVGDQGNKQNSTIITIDPSGHQRQRGEIKMVISSAPWDILMKDENIKFFEKISHLAIPMGTIVEMSKGMVVKNRNSVLTISQVENSLPFLLGSNMKRYHYNVDKYAVYSNLEIIGGTREITKHLSIPRLFIRRTGGILCATYSENEELVESTIYLVRSQTIDLKYLLGLLNSKLLTFYLKKKLITNSQGFPQILMSQLEKLPIVTGTSEYHQIISSSVDQLLQLNIDKQTASLQSKLNQIQSKIEYCEDKINKIVYELYGLTDEEIKMVEGA
ncbi:MAG: N-6 DNA methylase [Ignavibacteria bacterium]|nr:N-6 DNA methylase [Ignavibacteria bacterium]